MNYIVDNLIAYRILSMLVTPFKETDAYKLGIIDEVGHNLIKASKFTSQEQKDAYNYLTRLVFNLKKILNKLPGGDAKLKNIVAAFFLIKESYEKRQVVHEDNLINLINILEQKDITLVSEQLIVEEFFQVFLNEEGAPANVTGAAVSTDQAVIRKPKRFGRFVVNDKIFNKFADGKAKYRRWSQYLNNEDEGEMQIYKFAKKNPYSAIILHNGKDTKVISMERKKREKK